MRLTWFLSILLALSTPAFSQSAKHNSFINIEATSGKLVATGSVSALYLKVMVADLLRKTLSPDVSTEGILVDETTHKLPYGWDGDLRTALRDRERWRNGVFVFEVDVEKRSAAIVASIAQTQIKVLGKTGHVPLLDPVKKATLLYLFATWCGPCRTQLPEILSLDKNFAPAGLDIILIDADDEPESDIREFHEKLNISLRTTVVSLELNTKFLELSEFDGIPQAFLFKDGKLISIYRGAHPKENERMRNDITAIIGK